MNTPADQLRAAIDGLPRWGMISRGGEPAEMDHTRHGQFLSRSDVLRALASLAPAGEREGGALPPQQEPDADDWRALMANVTANSRRVPAPAGERATVATQSCEECAATGEVDVVDGTGAETTITCAECGGLGRIRVSITRIGSPAGEREGGDR